jgi:uncharacterized membrane protein YoaK (UPF0700 family)
MTEGLPTPGPHERTPPEAERLGYALPIVWLLTALAGAVDARGATVLKDLYVSFMSGNTTALGRALADGDWGRAGLIAEIVAAFVAGAAAGTVLASVAGAYRLASVTLCVGIILGLSGPFDAPSIPLLTFAMGGLNAALQHVGGLTIRITYVTGTLVKLGQGVGRLLCGDTGHWRWAEQATLWPAMLAGVVLTAGLQSTHPVAIGIGLQTAAFAVSALTFATVWRTQRHPAEAAADRI